MDNTCGSEVISAATSTKDDQTLAGAILGTTDAGRILEDLQALCGHWLSSDLEEVLFCTLGVGATFGLRLRDGRRVALKAHPPGTSPDFLRAARKVQEHSRRRGFPAPGSILGPVPFGNGLATVDELLEQGELAGGQDPAVRRLMARTLNRLIELSNEVSGVEALSQGWNWPARDELWPPPHNALFDFGATAAGAGWIDEMAANAKGSVDEFRGPVVIGHADWSVDQMRFEGNEVGAVYDWDSLRFDKEVVFVGIAASNFAATWHKEPPNPPTPEEAKLFVADFEAARTEPFSEGERGAIFAAAVYAIAYIARCEHAIDRKGEKTRGSFREILPSYAEAFLAI